MRASPVGESRSPQYIHVKLRHKKGSPGYRPAVILAAFRLFGATHLAALLAVGAMTAGLALWARRPPSPPRFALARRALGALLLLSLVAEQVALAASGRWDATWSLPFELCDLASVASACALLSLRPALFELAYFWAFSGTVLALVTPDLTDDFPHPEYFRFFAHHGGSVAAVALLVAGAGLAPRAGAWLRALAWTVGYAAFAGAVDLALGANYFYLREKPEGWTPLALFGPWPVYIGGGAGAAALLFWSLERPWRRRAASAP